MTGERLRRGLDRLGWLELAGTGIWIGVVFALEVAHLVSATRDESSPSPTSWRIGAIAGAVICVVMMLLVARRWRKHGGRGVQRLGRRAWMTGRLPTDLVSRVAVLRDLERRERDLERARIPAWGLAAFWTALIAWHLATDSGPTAALTWLALWTLFLGTGVKDVLDRRRRARIRRLITDLRQNPAPTRTAAL